MASLIFLELFCENDDPSDSTYVPQPCQDLLADAACAQSIDALSGTAIGVVSLMVIAGTGIEIAKNRGV